MLGSLNKVWIFLVLEYIRLKGNDAVKELIRKGTGTPLYGSEPFLMFENGFMAITLEN